MRTPRTIMPILFPLVLLACGSTGPAAGPSPVALIERPLLSSPRATHATAVTDRMILLIGGCVLDGCEAGAASATVDMIPRGGGTRAVGTLLVRRVQPSAAAIPGGTVLVAGGWVDGRVDAGTEIFDERNGRSRRGPMMATPRSAAAIVTLGDGRVLIAGGYDGTGPLASAEIYDPADRRLHRTGALHVARSGATATRLRDGRVLIVGGGTGDGHDRVALASAEIFDPATGRFTPTGALGARRYKHGAVAMPDGSVLIVGGADERDYSGKIASLERFDPVRGRFSPADRLAEARFKLADASVLLPSGKILVAGGYDRPEVFDPASGTSRLLPVSLGGQWNYLSAALAGDSVVLASGYSEGSIRPTARNWTLRL